MEQKGPSMVNELRSFQVKVKMDVWTMVTVTAVDSEQAVLAAVQHCPSMPAVWEVKRTRQEIINVSRVEGGIEQ